MGIIAVYPGSFDPVTLGHMDLIRRAAGLFDQVIVGVLINADKKSPLFSLEERVIMLKDACRDITGVSVESFEGLLIDFVKSKKTLNQELNQDLNQDQNHENRTGDPDRVVIIRGLRELMDFDMELQMAQVNRIASREINNAVINENINGNKNLDNKNIDSKNEEEIETLFLPTDPKYSHVSSSVVREYGRYGVPLKEFVPENVLQAMKKKYQDK